MIKLFKNTIVFSIAIFLVFLTLQFVIEYFSFILLFKLNVEVAMLSIYSRLLSFIIIGIFLYYIFSKNKIPFETKNINYWTILLAVILALCSLLFLRLIYNFIYEYEFLHINGLNFKGIFIWPIVTSVIVTPIVEEFLFRQMILNQLLIKNYNLFFSILFSSILFALVHTGLIGMLTAFSLGIILGLIFAFTRNIYYCIIFHSSYNFFRLMTNINNSTEPAYILNIGSSEFISIISMIGLVGVIFLLIYFIYKISK